MRYLTLILFFLLSAAPACDSVTAQAEKPTETTEQDTPKHEPEPQPTKPVSKESEMKYFLFRILVNQLCADENGINEVCRKFVTNCYAKDVSSPANIDKCFDEWEEGKP